MTTQKILPKLAVLLKVNFNLVHVEKVVASNPNDTINVKHIHNANQSSTASELAKLDAILGPERDYPFQPKYLAPFGSPTTQQELNQRLNLVAGDDALSSVSQLDRIDRHPVHRMPVVIQGQSDIELAQLYATSTVGSKSLRPPDAVKEKPSAPVVDYSQELRAMQDKQWNLTRVPGTGPVEGSALRLNRTAQQQNGFHFTEVAPVTPYGQQYSRGGTVGPLQENASFLERQDFLAKMKTLRANYAN